MLHIGLIARLGQMLFEPIFQARKRHGNAQKTIVSRGSCVRLQATKNEAAAPPLLAADGPRRRRHALGGTNFGHAYGPKLWFV